MAHPPARPPRPSALPEREQPARRRAPSAEAIAAASPWLPVPYERHHVVALQAVAAGNASPEQQKMAMKWLLEAAAGVYDMTYFPGPEGARNSDFAQGRRFVGLQVVKLLHLNPGLVKAAVPQADQNREQG